MAKVGYRRSGIATSTLAAKADDEVITGKWSFTDAFTSRSAADPDAGVIAKALGDGSAAPFAWIHDDTAGYLLHLTPGPNFASPTDGAAALIGLGTSATTPSGSALLVSNKGVATKGIRLINTSTAGDNALHGTHQGTSKFALIESGVGAGDALLNLSDASGALSTAGKPIQEWTWTGGQAGQVVASNGRLRWIADIEARGNIRIGANASNAGAAKALCFENGTAPASNPTGGVAWVEAGALKYRGSAGTVTTLAVA